MRLNDYLSRIGAAPPVERSPDTLRRLHLAHREAFLFENISIQTGGAIRLALPDLERKFLDEGRGGYCFEHNTLFAAALRDVGFTPTIFLGRVRRGPPERWCRTHMVLRVDDLLADVGFGGLGLLEPIPLRDGATAEQGGIEYALHRDNGLWVLSMRPSTGSGRPERVEGRDAAATVDLYEFSDDPQTPWDVEVANHFTSTHPESIFRKSLTIQRTRSAERTILRSDALTRYREGRLTEEPVARDRLAEVARAEFGVELPNGPFVFEATPR